MTMVPKSDYRLDLADERLWRGNEPVQIGAKAFRLLRLLVSNPDRLLTKEDILNSVWGDVIVSEGLVKEYVHDLRVALEDDPKAPKFIETVHGRGYRFLGGVEAVDPSHSVDPRTQPDRPSIAVLPLKNISGDPEEEYFADGLTEEIITALSFVPWLFVVGRNSSFIYRNSNRDFRKISAELGIRYLMEGSIRRAGERIRVNGRLIDAESGTQIWANRYESDLADVFDLQDEITDAVVGAIGPKIQLAEIARATRRRPSDLTAYDLYLRARAALNSVDIDAASDLLDQAIERAPDYAKAKAVKAWCTTLIGWHFIAPSRAQRETSLRLAEDALGSPQADAEVQAYAGYTIGFMSKDRQRAFSLVEEVTQQCPSFAWAWASLALLESYHGAPQRAIELAETALRLNPRDPQSFRCEMAICKSHLVLKQYEKSLEYAELGLQKCPSNAFFQMCQITCLVQMNRLEEAHATAGRFRESNPDFTITKWRELACNWDSWSSALPVLEGAMRTVHIPG
jgi:TolB-like protein